MRLNSFAVLMVTAGLATAPSAWADTIAFSFSGGGISSSGTFTIAPTATPGIDEITGISGTFTDTNAGISGTITGLFQPVSYSSSTPPASTPAEMSYDDLFYPGGNSPAVCPGYPFSGGVLDVYGVTFDVSGGYVAGLWSDGVIPGVGLLYGAGDASGATVLDPADLNAPGPDQGAGVAVSVTTTPEPGYVFSLAAGLLVIAAARARKRKTPR